MADRPLGMAHVSDFQLRRLAASIEHQSQHHQGRPAMLPLPTLRIDPERLGFTITGPVPHDLEAYAVHDGRRVARLELVE